jgi:hypothetical protein
MISSTLRPIFLQEEKNYYTHLIKRWVGPRGDFGVAEKREISLKAGI